MELTNENVIDHDIDLNELFTSFETEIRSTILPFILWLILYLNIITQLYKWNHKLLIIIMNIHQ